jgi:hypothetical protein
MNHEELLRSLREHFEGLFPKTCSCGRRFATLREYILGTELVRGTISYDAASGDWKPTQLLGTLALANCPCGSTLALTTEGLPLATRHLLLAWVRAETERRGVSPEEVVGTLRDEIRTRLLTDPVQDPP